MKKTLKEVNQENEEELNKRFKFIRAYDKQEGVERFCGEDIKNLNNQSLLKTLKNIVENGKKDIPKLGSENQDEYVTYSNGYNDCLEKILTPIKEEIKRLEI